MIDNVKINYRFYFWGPFLYSTKIKEEEKNKIYKLCNKEEDYRKNLAGIIKEEYKIDSLELLKIIKIYLHSYLIASENFYGKKIQNNFTIIDAWVNFMKKNEFNPPHKHDGDLSCVLYLKIPQNLKKENKSYIGRSGGPGAIDFMYGYTTMDKFNITTHSFLPETGNLYIFPSSLIHMVSPFKSTGVRISVSANFRFT